MSRFQLQRPPQCTVELTFLNSCVLGTAALPTYFLYNQTANSAFRDVVHRIHQGVLYCQNAIMFHGTRVPVPVTVCMCIKSCTVLPAAVFTKLTNSQRRRVHISRNELHSNRTGRKSTDNPLYSEAASVPVPCDQALQSNHHLLYNCFSFSLNVALQTASDPTNHVCQPNL